MARAASATVVGIALLLGAKVAGNEFLRIGLILASISMLILVWGEK